MLEFRADRSSLLSALAAAKEVADPKSTMPILGNVVLDGEGCGLRVLATDLNISLIQTVDAEIVSEGRLCLPARRFTEIVKGLDGDRVHVQTPADSANMPAAKHAEIRAGKSKYGVPGLDPKDWPRMPDPSEIQFTPFPRDALSTLIVKALPSVSDDRTRYHMNGGFLVREGKRVQMVGTNGHMLGLASVEIPLSLADGVLIPKDALIEIQRVLKEADDEVSLGFGRGHTWLRSGGVLLTLKLSDAQFPPFAQIIPREHGRVAVLDRGELLRALKRIVVVASDKTWAAKYTFANNLLKIEADTPDVGDGVEEMEIEYTGAPLVIGLNSQYVINQLSVMESERAWFGLAEGDDGGLAPVTLKPAGKDGKPAGDYLGVVMPVRL